MTLYNYLKTQAPGWTVRGLALSLEYSESGLQKIWREHPVRIRLWVDGLKYQSEEKHDV